MTTDELARKLAAHPRWEWREGMESLQGGLTLRYLGPGGHAIAVSGFRDPEAPELPDLSDPATAGVLLAMLADERGCERVETWTYSTGAAVRIDLDELAPDEQMHWLHAPTLGEAAARALLAVWEEA